MPAPSYTYTLTNGTTADAPQVMQNFNDILNGVTDGTDDLTISALTCQGNFTVNGSSITLGNSSADTLTVNASLGSHVVPSTTNTYDFGSSSIGVRSIYFADAGNASRGTRLIGGTIATGYTITLPTAAPASTKIVTMDNTGALAVAYDTDNSTLEVSSNSLRIKDSGVVTAKIADSNVTAAKVESSINLPGDFVKENGKAIIVSNTNPSTKSLAVVRGKVTAGASPSVARGEGFTVVRTAGSGLYDITFSTAFAEAPVVVGTSINVTTLISVVNEATTGVRIQVSNSTSGGALDVDFHFVAIGQRA